MSVSFIAPMRAWWDSDLAYDFRRSPVAIVSTIVTIILIGMAIGADFLAPYNVNDPASANVIDARLPPGSSGMFGGTFLLGTDPQGRDMLSAVIFGLRTSLLVGGLSVLLAASVGIILGLLSGYFGGWLDAAVMRIADVQLSFPAILIALLIDGVSRTAMDRATHDALAIPVLVIAIAASYWVQYARTVRALVLVERDKDYVLAARVTGIGPLAHHAHAHPPERAGSRGGHRHDQSRARDPDRSNPVASSASACRRRCPHLARWCGSETSSCSPATGGYQSFPERCSCCSRLRSTCLATGCAMR